MLKRVLLLLLFTGGALRADPPAAAPRALVEFSVMSYGLEQHLTYFFRKIPSAQLTPDPEGSGVHVRGALELDLQSLPEKMRGSLRAELLKVIRGERAVSGATLDFSMAHVRFLEPFNFEAWLDAALADPARSQIRYEGASDLYLVETLVVDLAQYGDRLAFAVESTFATPYWQSRVTGKKYWLRSAFLHSIRGPSGERLAQSLLRPAPTPDDYARVRAVLGDSALHRMKGHELVRGCEPALEFKDLK